MKKLKLLAAVGLGLAASSMHAADYVDVAAAVDAVEGIPAIVTVPFLAFVTLSVGVLTVRLVAKFSKKGASVA